MAAEPGLGRRRGAGKALACAMLLVGSPLFIAYVWLSCEAYGCAISGPLLDVVLGRGRSPGPGVSWRLDNRGRLGVPRDGRMNG